MLFMRNFVSTQNSDFGQETQPRCVCVAVALGPTLHMPPWRAWFSGRSAVRAFFTKAWQGYGGFRARVFRANGRSAIAVYACMADDDAWRPCSFHVLEVSEGAVASIVAFVGPLAPSLFSNMGLPLRPPNPFEAFGRRALHLVADEGQLANVGLE